MTETPATTSRPGPGRPPATAFGLLDITPYGRGEAWEEAPDGWPEGQGSCWYWASDADGVATGGPASRPVPQWTRPGAGPVVDGHGHPTDRYNFDARCDRGLAPVGRPSGRITVS
jgi:hypothetical protein